MTATEKKTLEKGLAWRIAVASEMMDPYEFRDTYEDMKEAATCTLSTIRSDPQSVFDILEGWEDDAEGDEKKALAALRQELAEYMTA